MSYVADPNNPGWLLLEGADAALESSWWQLPDGYVADPANPGWYYRDGSDVSQQSNWVHDPSVADAPSTAPRILNTEGADIGPMMQVAADTSGIPIELALTCAIAESGLNPKAARYGTWPDISFSYGQQIVLYHYLGDHSNTQANINAVRDAVFADPQGNLNDMCKRLAADLQRVRGVDLSPVAGDPLIAALVVYNSGAWRTASDPWWNQWAGNVRNYQAAQVRARAMLGGNG